MWPGYGQNMRALAWIVGRVRGQAKAVESPFGFMPRFQDITWAGLAFDQAKFSQLMEISQPSALREIDDQNAFFGRFGAHVPAALLQQQAMVRKRIEAAPPSWHPDT